MNNEKIQQQIDEAISTDGKFPGMTYEEGVRAALEWVLKGCPENENPMD